MENLSIGDVLLLEDFAPRCPWPLGRVTKLFHDKHGVVRNVQLSTAGGTFERPITKLCVLVPTAQDVEKDN